MVDIFEATFQDKITLNALLVNQWFNMARQEFAVEIEPLNFDTERDVFIYLDKDGNEIPLPYLYVLILGYTIKKYYCERQYDKIIKRTNIIGKDLTLNNTDADKKNAKTELDYINETINNFYDKLKPTAYK